MIGSELMPSKADGSSKSRDRLTACLISSPDHENTIKPMIRYESSTHISVTISHHRDSVVHFQDLSAESVRCTTIPNVLANLQQARDIQSRQPEGPHTPSGQIISPILNFYAGKWEELTTILSVVESYIPELPKAPNLSFSKEDFMDGCGYSMAADCARSALLERVKLTWKMQAKENLLENVEDLTSLEAENKTRTIINLKGKNERLLKKIQETNLKSHVTDVTNLDTMPMNVQTNARIKSENKSAETAESAEIAESAETAGSTETAGSAENFKIRSILQSVRKGPTNNSSTKSNICSNTEDVCINKGKSVLNEDDSLVFEVESDDEHGYIDRISISKEYLDHGDLTIQCGTCHAMLWQAKANRGSNHVDTAEGFSLCCGRGNINYNVYLNIQFSNWRGGSSSSNSQMDRPLTKELKTKLDRQNPLVKRFRMASLKLAMGQQNVKVKLIGARPKDARQYNLPTANEVAALIVGDFDSMPYERDIIVYENSGNIKKISELHVSYLSLQYPMLFPYAKDGYRTDVLNYGLTEDTPEHLKNIRYKKRGLPHCHLCIWLETENKLRLPADIDRCISAEIPDEDEDPELLPIG
ncbi:hypothetical protein Tco_0532760 [Tanacetum coccineum]